MIPDTSAPCWHSVLTTEHDISGAILATKALVTRLRREVRARPAALDSKIAELRAYFEKNLLAVKDIALL